MIAVVVPLIVAGIAGYFAIVQIRINNITNARLKWLDRLKELLSMHQESSKIVSEASSEREAINRLWVAIRDRQDMDHQETKRIIIKQKDISVEAEIQNLWKMNDCLSTIILNLNPIEPPHVNLKALLEKQTKIVQSLYLSKYEFNPNLLIRQKKLNELEQIRSLVLDLSQLVLKMEWEHAKLSEDKFKQWQKGLGKQIVDSANDIRYELTE